MPGYPGVGDRLWGLLGLPWLASIVLPTGALARRDPDLGAVWLAPSLGAVALVAMITVWETWVVVSAEQARANFAGSWTNRVGLVLAVAWPLQCALGMVAIAWVG
jgi:hypothetical protein